MRIRAMLFMSLAAMAVVGIGASGASAATLYTSAAHTTTVSLGATLSATTTTPPKGIRLTSGTATVNNCTHATINGTVGANTGGAIVIDFGSGAFSGCNIATTFAGAWALDIFGSGSHGTSQSGAASLLWPATFTNVHMIFGGGTYQGNIVSGEGGTITMSQGTTSGTGLCLNLSNAGTLSGPLTTVGKIDSQYCFTGTAANWSLN